MTATTPLSGIALPLVTVLVALAGCTSSPGPAEPLAGPADAMPAPQAVAPGVEAAVADVPAMTGAVETVFTWTGHVAVGAFYEIPAHQKETEPYTTELWRAGFIFDVHEVPERLEFALDWTGVDASQVQLMVHSPYDHDRADGWPEYVTEFSSEKHQCLQVPPEEILAGTWYVMVHTLAGADLGLNITSTLVGGVAEIHDGPHGHPFSATELQNLVLTQVKGVKPSLPCETA